MNKKYSERIHFKNRVQERLGLTINRVDVINLVNSILNNDNVFKTYKISQRKTIYDMIFLKNRCFIFFDHKRKAPITIYSKDMDISNILRKCEGE